MPTIKSLLAPFVPLRHRNFRLLWTGTLISNTGDWIDQIALNWLVLQTTGSPAMLGLINLCRGVPVLIFTLVGGAAADRMDRRRLMLMTQSSAMVVAVLLMVMVYTGHTVIWLLCLVATLRGTIISFNLPARHSLVSNLVPRDDLPRAIALNAMTMNLTKVLGPLAAGALIATLGLTACFLVNALTFIPVLACLLAMRFPKEEPKTQTGSVMRNIVDGFSYILSNQAVRLLVLIALIPNFFAQPYIALLAIFVSDVYALGPGELGLFTASAACGAIFGGLMVSTFAKFARRGTTMLALLLAYGGLIVCFAANPSAGMAPIILFGVGAMHIAYNACNNTILQMIVPDDMRGRVLSVLFLNKSMVQFGTFFIATLSVVIGAQWALALSGSVVVLAACILAVTSPVMRRLYV